jgi:hypothetical protein
MEEAEEESSQHSNRWSGWPADCFSNQTDIDVCSSSDKKNFAKQNPTAINSEEFSIRWVTKQQSPGILALQEASPHSNDSNYRRMKPFPAPFINDFKHVLYNLLVENHNNPLTCSFLQPFSVTDKSGKTKHGFRFPSIGNPEKKLAELYAQHIRKARLEWAPVSNVFVEDLYRFYFRAVLELISKYFEKVDHLTYLYDQVPLFVPNESLKDAEARLNSMNSRSRNKRKAKNTTERLPKTSKRH